MNRFILASQSPRRKELLASIGLDFEVIVSDADESVVSKENTPVNVYVQELALIKAATSAKQVLKDKNAIIISADTIVVLDGKILGKPKNEDDAFDMLKSLSGRTHEVYTGYCVMRIKDGYTVCNSIKTEVTFKTISDDKILRYIRTSEPMDKAGAYGIQGIGGMLVEKIEGDYANVVGLPTSALADTLEKEFEINLI
ncbi:MAG: Maf family protein [Clostridia bacterium]|nr:Maf family protein [Clostridia bacterium]